jgi:hypothetical protein
MVRLTYSQKTGTWRFLEDETNRELYRICTYWTTYNVWKRNSTIPWPANSSTFKRKYATLAEATDYVMKAIAAE